MQQQHKFNYSWKLANGYPAAGIVKHDKKVFTTFACGGGSSMGYKLAGYDVFAANDIDPQMEKVYIKNHNPKYFFKSDIRSLLNKQFPEEFNNLDLLDGSPPCSTFSMSGSREKAWGKEKMFREGQAMQVLDDLFFEFIALTKKLQPKVFIAENVKGMLNGNAKGYLVEIFKGFEEAGYKVQLFCFNASTMGVPQRRERVFFIGHKKEFDLPKLVMEFNEVPIPLKEFYRYEYGRPLTGKYLNLWYKVKPGDTFDKATGKSWFSKRKLSPDVVLPTLTAHCVTDMCMYDSPKKIPRETIIQGGSFPLDYNFIDVEPGYLVGMSVPPIMTAQVACKVYEQWLSKL